MEFDWLIHQIFWVNAAVYLSKTYFMCRLILRSLFCFGLLPPALCQLHPKLPMAYKDAFYVLVPEKLNRGRITVSSFGITVKRRLRTYSDLTALLHMHFMMPVIS